MTAATRPADTDLQPPESDGLEFLHRASLTDRDGVTFREFRRRLTPRYGLVWTHLGMGYAALGAVGAAVVLTAGTAPLAARVAVGALLFGFVQAFIQLFFHEAAHYNLARGRERNDRLANLFVGALHGLEISSYRMVHFEHHRRLGTTTDTERTYFDPLNMRFFARALLGAKALEVLTSRDATVSRGPVNRAAAWRQRVLAVVIHGAVAGGALLAGEPALAAAWTLGTLSVMPLFVALRQLLEHRSESADARVDYTTVNHGAVNRLFGDGLLASTLGGAGFNRHLLHHWEPQISYTRLRELERYLDGTPAAEALARHRGTYWQTFWALVSW
jgi:fatty acid desaturase